MLIRYYETEPWGPWRDNFHAALVCREIRMLLMSSLRPADRRPVKLKDFMFVSPVQRDIAAERRSFFDIFRAMAKKRVPLQRKPKGARR